MKVISFGMKNGRRTAMVIIDGRTKHLIHSRGIVVFTDSKGKEYNIG